jgi:hypothetical protein
MRETGRVSAPIRRRLSPVLLALALVLTACGGGNRGTDAASPSGPGASPAPDATVAWKARSVALPDGRTFYVALPTCTGSDSCAAWLRHPRKLVIWAHGYGEPETAQVAESTVGAMASVTGGDTVPVYAISAGGTRAFDADLCCTFHPVDELGYLDAVIAKVGELTPIDTHRVGLVGVSNGGMLATKAICARPKTFAAVAIWAANWKGPCDRGPIVLRHWHGEADTDVRLQGGVIPIAGHQVQLPPSDWLEGRLAPGSDFELTTLPGLGHAPLPPRVSLDMLTWLDGKLQTSP